MSDIGVTEQWIVVWFPPDVDKRERKYRSEGDARSFADHGTHDDLRIRDWNPLLVHRVTTVTERMIAL